MKYAANRTQSTVKAKAKTLSEGRTVKKIKPAAKRPVNKVALKPRSQKPVKKSKVVAKTAPKDLPRAPKPAAKQTVPKLSAKTLGALKTLSVRKAKPALKQKAQPKSKNVAAKTLVKTIKVSTKKTKTKATNKKVTAAKTVKVIAATPKAKLKAAATKPKTFVKASAETSVKTKKSKSPKVAVQKTKRQRQPKVKVAAPVVKIKSVRQTAKPNVAGKKPRNFGKTKPIIATQPARGKKIAPTVPARRVNLKSKKIQPIVQAKKSGKKAERIRSLAVAKKVVKRTQKLKPAISAATFGKSNRIIKKAVSVEKYSAVTNAIKVIQPPAPKPKNRKARPIGSAVFRGKKALYDFKVFALNEKFEPIPAVYIISRRKTDRHKRGHHALICIGETDSISDELKRHRKGKCVKKHEANVVSILPETDEKMRLKIETDLKAAHAVVCNLN
jgi:hypothetical protein